MNDKSTPILSFNDNIVLNDKSNTFTDKQHRLIKILKNLCGESLTGQYKFRKAIQYLNVIDVIDKSYIPETMNNSLIQYKKYNIHNDISYEPVYKKNYIQLELLGKGGFGEVFSAKYYLDKNIYAIKKINIPEDKLSYIKLILTEIMILSHLEHKNIVRYYTSWLEHSLTNNDDYNILENSKIKEIKKQHSEIKLVMNTKQFTYSTVKKATKDSYSSISTSNTSNYENNIHNLVFYIQMELCQNHSLGDIINELNAKQKIIIIKQIIEGVKYLHSCNIIHKDLKPKNILFSTRTNEVKIADFGLASIEQNIYDENSSKGSILYKDPHIKYNNKTLDIYSIGVILTELLCKFSTGMERIIVLSNLKKGVLPEIKLDIVSLETIHKIKNVIEKCITPDIDSRYTIDNLYEIFQKLFILIR
mgnify:FL=1